MRGGVRLLLALVLVTACALWVGRAPILRTIGGVLVAEDALGPADVIAVSHANVLTSLRNWGLPVESHWPGGGSCLRADS